MSDLDRTKRQARPARARMRGRLMQGTALAGLVALGVAAGGLAQGALAQTTQATADETIRLDPIDVEGRGATTEGSGSYASPRADLGGKGAVELREIPQTVNVVTRERIEDRNMTELEDAIEQTPGTRVFRNDKGRSSLFIRGFEIDSFFIDGIYSPLNSALGFQPDLAPYDRVEVLKGPSALYAGTGEPGGTVNLARKRAMADFAASAALSYGMWNDARVEADVTGALVESGRIRGRAVGALEKADSFKDVNENGVGVFYGTLEADLTPDTTLSLAWTHQQREGRPDNALPTYADGTLLDIDRDTFIGANWNDFESRSDELLAELEHEFDNGARTRLAARWTDRDADAHYAFGAGAIAEDGTVPLRSAALNGEERSLALDAYYDQPFQLFGQEHNVLVGADFRDWERTQLQGGAAGFGTNNVFSPNPDVPEPAYAYTRQSRVSPTEYGLYGQLRLRPVERLTLIGGGRVSWYDADVDNLVAGTTTQVTHNGELSPYAGATLDVLPWLTLFASYSEVFQPQSEVDASGFLLPAREATQYETGVKADLMDGALTAGLSLFWIEDTNRAIGDPSVPGTSIASGRIDSQGVELELSGSPMESLDLYASYSYLDMDYRAGSASQSYRFYMPQHQVGVWAKWSFEEGVLDGLSVAGGANYTSSFHNTFNGIRLEEDGYLTLDAQVAYRFTEKVEGVLSVNNILEEEYYERLGTPATFNFYGPPRSVMATLRVAW